MGEKQAKKVDHTNIFESYLAQDIFVMDIIDKIASDWKRAERRASTFNRENLEDFVYDEFQQWIELGLQEWCDEEWGLENDEID